MPHLRRDRSADRVAQGLRRLRWERPGMTHAQSFNQSEIPMRVPIHCAGKEPFDRATANRVCRETRSVRLSSYRCDHCGHWHIGLPQSGRRAIKRKRMRDFGGEA